MLAKLPGTPALFSTLPIKFEPSNVSDTVPSGSSPIVTVLVEPLIATVAVQFVWTDDEVSFVGGFPVNRYVPASEKFSANCPLEFVDTPVTWSQQSAQFNEALDTEIHEFVATDPVESKRVPDRSALPYWTI
jgi:hypothetical protein